MKQSQASWQRLVLPRKNSPHASNHPGLWHLWEHGPSTASTLGCDLFAEQNTFIMKYLIPLPPSQRILQGIQRPLTQHWRSNYLNQPARDQIRYQSGAAGKESAFNLLNIKSRAELIQWKHKFRLSSVTFWQESLNRVRRNFSFFFSFFWGQRQE